MRKEDERFRLRVYIYGGKNKNFFQQELLFTRCLFRTRLASSFRFLFGIIRDPEAKLTTSIQIVNRYLNSVDKKDTCEGISRKENRDSDAYNESITCGDYY